MAGCFICLTFDLHDVGTVPQVSNPQGVRSINVNEKQPFNTEFLFCGPWWVVHTVGVTKLAKRPMDTMTHNFQENG